MNLGWNMAPYNLANPPGIHGNEQVVNFSNCVPPAHYHYWDTLLFLSQFSSLLSATLQHLNRYSSFQTYPPPAFSLSPR